MDAGDGASGEKGRGFFSLCPYRKMLHVNGLCGWSLTLHNTGEKSFFPVGWCERGPWWETLVWKDFVVECNPDGEAFGSGPQILQGKAQQ